MSDIDNGGPAFPVLFKGRDNEDFVDAFGTEIPNGLNAQYGGMTLRDYFAAKAMHLLWQDASSMPCLARGSYQIADAMLNERRK